MDYVCIDAFTADRTHLQHWLLWATEIRFCLRMAHIQDMWGYGSN